MINDAKLMAMQCKECGWPQGDDKAWEYDPPDGGGGCPKCGGLLCDLDYLSQYDRAKLRAWTEAAKP
jgi:hypothetical protein